VSFSDKSFPTTEVPTAFCGAGSRENPAEGLAEMLAVMGEIAECTGAAFWHFPKDCLLTEPECLSRWGNAGLEVPTVESRDPGEGAYEQDIHLAGEFLGRVILQGPRIAADDSRLLVLNKLCLLLSPMAFAAVTHSSSRHRDPVRHELYRLGDELVSSESVGHLCRKMAEGLAKAFGAGDSAVWLRESADSDLLLQGYVSPDAVPRIRPRPGSLLHTLVEGIPVVTRLESVTETDRRAFPGAPDHGWVLGIPLRMGESVVGLVMIVGDIDPGLFRRVPTIRAQELGSRLGCILESRRIIDERERNMSNFQHLLDTSRAVSSVLQVAEVPKLVAQAAMDLCEADQSVLFLLQPDGETMKPVVCLGPDAEAFLQLEAKLGEGITGSVAMARTPEIVNDPNADPRAVQVPGTEEETGEAILAVPLICADSLVGVLTLYRLDGGVFRAVDLDTVNVFSSHAAIAIENAHLFASVHRERTRFATMLLHMREGVVLGDGDGLTVLANPAVVRILGRKEAPVGRPLDELFADDAFQPVREAIRLARENGSDGGDEIRLGDATYLVSVSPVPGESGRTGEVVLFHDISEAKRMESRLVESNKMSAVGQLAAGVAHEFNNLIAGISGYAQLLKMNPDPAMIEKGTRVILESTERAQQLTGGLLTFSRRRSGAREAISFHELVSTTLLLLDRSLETHRIRVEHDLSHLPQVHGDGGELQQVMLNLLINAQHAVSSDGVIRVTGAHEGDTVEVVVEDSGPGIPEDIRGRIFEPFFTTKGPLGASKVPGVGLGLTTAYNIVRDHGGTIHAENAEGGGARIVLRLRGFSRSQGSVSDPVSLPDPDRRVLILQGDPACRESVESIIQGMGYTPWVRPEGEPVPGEEPILAVLDRLPGLGLKSPFQPLRARFPNLPVLFLVDREQSEMSAGFSDPWVFLLCKPFRDRDLASLAERLIGRRLRAAS